MPFIESNDIVFTFIFPPHAIAWNINSCITQLFRVPSVHTPSQQFNYWMMDIFPQVCNSNSHFGAGSLSLVYFHFVLFMQPKYVNLLFECKKVSDVWYFTVTLYNIFSQLTLLSDCQLTANVHFCLSCQLLPNIV